jgi:hypothetical protein
MFVRLWRRLVWGPDMLRILDELDEAIRISSSMTTGSRPQYRSIRD